MPTNTSKYSNEELIQLLEEGRRKNTELKELMHTNVVYVQGDMPARRAMVSLGKKFGDMKVPANKALKKRDKKSGKKAERKIRITRIQPKLAKFLRLKERGLPTDIYYDAIVMSYVADWVDRECRSDGVYIKLFGKDDPFVLLFKEELSLPGSGPDQVEEDTNLFQAPAYEEDGTPTLDSSGNQLLLTSVLDKEGNPVKPFARCKHMFIFKNMYVQKKKLQGNKYVYQRDVLVGEERNVALAAIEREKDLFVNVLKPVRTRYKTCLKNYEDLHKKQEEARSIGDSSVRSSLVLAKKELANAADEYTKLLTANNLTHKIKV